VTVFWKNHLFVGHDEPRFSARACHEKQSADGMNKNSWIALLGAMTSAIFCVIEPHFRIFDGELFTRFGH
jgi:hypothetical protein